MPKSLSTEARALKRARKIFRKFYFLLLETDIMDDVNLRRKYQSALLTVDDNYHQKKKPV